MTIANQIESNVKSRTQKRRERVHQDILNVASKLICEKGSSAVSLEAISLEADVARKTVYNHFENKEALIKELVMPVCNHAMGYLKKNEASQSASLEDIWTYCLELWSMEELNALLLYQVSIEDYPDLAENKHGFILVFKRLLARIQAYEKSNEAELEYMAECIYAVYMPLLQTIYNNKSISPELAERNFRKAMTAMINAQTFMY